VTENQNRLKDSASPYLRSAAHQPIDWHEWGDEAFARAKKEDKPILLDIGAVWCHWCHVIDRESYENPEIAALISQHYVAVKVDRDERPDVDARYQAAIGALSGQGGWPLTGFLTPEGKPFFGGTYFPPDDAMGRPGFKRILQAIADAYQTKRKDVEESAAKLAEAIAQAESFQGAQSSFDARVSFALVDAITRMFDLRNGGFGRAPKFPHPTALDLLMEHHQSAREKHLLTVIESSLTRMARGGVYDQLAGGFHRYSVDEKWLVPHFEKMSYDNSELLKNYVHGWQVTRNPFYREVAEGIVGWVNAVLSDQANGGFYASQDADYSLEDDGDYFTWTLEELRAAVAPDEARVMELHYDVEAHGEMHHNPAKNVLWIARDAGEIAHQLALTETAVRETIARGKQKMLEARQGRPTPFVDTSLYTSWNAMFASAYFEVARALGRADCRDFALRTLERMEREAWRDEKGFAHRFGASDGAASLEGTLDDQVFTVIALLDAYEATLAPRWCELAERAMRVVLERYFDAQEGGFFDRATDAPPLGGLDVRRKPFQDSPTPSANAAAAIAVDRLYGLTGNSLYRERAQQTLEAFAAAAPQYGLFAASYGLAASLHARHAIQVVITGAAGDPLAARLEEAAHGVYRFGKAVLRVTPQTPADALAPALRQTIPHLDAAKAQALVCVETTCRPPITDPVQLAATLGSISGAASAIAG
jgi:uncharacterized protein YyaL (SSP411 family)